MVGGGKRVLIDAVSGVPQDSVFGPNLFISYIADMFLILKNQIVGHSEDSTLIEIV